MFPTSFFSPYIINLALIVVVVVFVVSSRLSDKTIKYTSGRARRKEGEKATKNCPIREVSKTDIDQPRSFPHGMIRHDHGALNGFSN